MSVNRLRKAALSAEEIKEIAAQDKAAQDQRLSDSSEELGRYRDQAIALINEDDIVGSIKAITSTFTEAKVYSVSDDDNKKYTVFLDFPEKGVIRLETTL